MKKQKPTNFPPKLNILTASSSGTVQKQVTELHFFLFSYNYLVGLLRLGFDFFAKQKSIPVQTPTHARAEMSGIASLTLTKINYAAREQKQTLL